MGQYLERGDEDDPGVVDQDVDLPVALPYRFDHRRDLGAVGDVADE